MLSAHLEMGYTCIKLYTCHDGYVQVLVPRLHMACSRNMHGTHAL